MTLNLLRWALLSLLAAQCAALKFSEFESVSGTTAGGLIGTKFRDDSRSLTLQPAAGSSFDGIFRGPWPASLNFDSVRRLVIKISSRSSQPLEIQLLQGDAWVTVGSTSPSAAFGVQRFTFTSDDYQQFSAAGKASMRIRSRDDSDQPAIDFLKLGIRRTKNTTPAPTRTNSAPLWWKPAPGLTWQWQLQGTIDTSFDVDVYDIDLFDAPQATIDLLHSQQRKVICYFSAGSFEEFRADKDQFPESALGNTLDGWPGERWLDIRNPVVRQIMTQRLDLAVTKKCDAVEPDNVDGYTNNPGFDFTAADQLDYNRFLATEAHARGLSIGLKNDLDQIGDLIDNFDWALNEQCFEFDECDLLSPFVAQGKLVLGVEYEGSPSSFCPRANELGFSWMKKKLDLKAEVLAACWSF